MQPSPQLAHALREHGLRLTRPRQAVWRALLEADGHLTAEELTEAASRWTTVNLASVYRSLALLEDMGLARQSRVGGGEAGRWEVAHPDEHFHMVCTSCGGVSHHVGELVAQITDHLSHGHGFTVDSVDLVVTGLCMSCADTGTAVASDLQ